MNQEASQWQDEGKQDTTYEMRVPEYEKSAEHHIEGLVYLILSFPAHILIREVHEISFEEDACH